MNTAAAEKTVPHFGGNVIPAEKPAFAPPLPAHGNGVFARVVITSVCLCVGGFHRETGGSCFGIAAQQMTFPGERKLHLKGPRAVKSAEFESCEFFHILRAARTAADPAGGIEPRKNRGAGTQFFHGLQKFPVIPESIEKQPDFVFADILFHIA